ncbi:MULTISPECIES: 2,3-diaminopropionate biosynthesis protein SbnA [Streptomyces]|jgi:cysteine synthase A|uniref:2,3-diaminopropionate biosynthesis protein SbnA n=1 Tax=Streptomyces TaxID=1883 RepID=UPI000F740748|nr:MULTISPECIES: 2,3-diaminopropionate biosynthesis protein SbnA [Streptomyces]MCM3262895.1 2,3-diaminopropionate biosynthesis protein SbnA [Streptomyces thermoviolaceus]RSS07813.1 2,3-diaminopropionate biosynthesis protein SbnA [Streptomyces sp. WAC00469]WTD47623.1 2,3-diaminopropionate biosynthesis protein SbnA [Streptomyces thermoviolaceus]GGV79745.1 2,3-diaminopropionate biosynthesis protein SbnA [Streptomyces thermoviolaceus subsp. apingens]
MTVVASGGRTPALGATRTREPDIVATIGSTPLVALDRLFPPARFQVYAKCERFNPGGSIKDRAAKSMIEHAIRSGKLVPGVSTVVESSSGNLGIALAQLCNFYRLKFICVVDPRTTRQNTAIMRAYGATVEVVDRDPATGEYLPARLERVRTLLRTVPDAYWPNQYANEYNARAHHHTMREICEALPGGPDYLFVAAGTTGTLRGCAEYIRESGLATRVVAVDAVGSVIFGPPEPWEQGHRRTIPGHGAAVVPPLLRPDLADRVVKVTDLDCVRGCRRLLAKESILAGGSSGAVIAALEGAADWLEPGTTCVAVLPDGGDRYLDTIYSDAWVESRFQDENPPLHPGDEGHAGHEPHTDREIPSGEDEGLHRDQERSEP